MDYKISFSNPLTRLVNISLLLNVQEDATINLYLPSWRPGRYELADYAQNILKLSILDADGHAIPYKKNAKNHWVVDVDALEIIEVEYTYYAAKMDAGGCWLDEHQLYLNFINCLIFDIKRINEPCVVKLKLPEDFQIACSLKNTTHHVLTADSYYQLVDAPMIASNGLQHFKYEIDDVRFNIWLMGEVDISWEKWEKDFKKFTQEQINTMGYFPGSNYHFLIQVLPYKFYHGVEHGDSTVITLGPGNSINDSPLYEALLGVSSHELFHVWNGINSRPKELTPYDFTREAFFQTGFVIEGFTTYYGNLFLVRSQTLSKSWFLEEISKQLNRHFNNFGRFNMSVADASMDLWLDGYKKGVPHRKVSIYVKGALIALILDLKIRQETQHLKSMDDVIKLLFEKFKYPANGYSVLQIEEIVGSLMPDVPQSFFKGLIYETAALENYLSGLLEWIGCQIKLLDPEKPYEKNYGIKLENIDGQCLVTDIHPDSKALEYLSLQDEIISVDDQVGEDLTSLFGTKESLELTLVRNYRKIKVKLSSGKDPYFNNYALHQLPHATPSQKDNFFQWLKIPW